MKPELTHDQERVLAFIWDYIEDNRYPPTMREIGDGLGIASTSSVHRFVHILAKKGYLTIGGKARTLQLHRTVTGRTA